jgi:hypothetical protein
MAEVFRNVGKVFRISSSVAGEGVNTYVLGDASDGIVSTIAIQLVGVGFTGSVTVKARARNPEAAQPVSPPMPAAPVAFVPIAYLALGAAPPTWSIAAITASALIEVPASGKSIALDVTAASAGEMWVYWTPCEGPCQTP